MNQVPIQLYLFPVISLLVGVIIFFSRRAAQASAERQYSDWRAGELAQRLGLRLLEGDPDFNLLVGRPRVNVQRGLIDKRTTRNVHILMRGEPHGLPLEFLYRHRVEKEIFLKSATWTTQFECRMRAYARQPFPPFEVVSHRTPLGPVARTQPLAFLPTGNPSVDSVYAVATQEPAMAELLGQVLDRFSAFASSGVHLVGDGSEVAFVLQKDKPPRLMQALSHADAMSRLISDLTRRVGG